jgi:hypothetical protein
MSGAWDEMVLQLCILMTSTVSDARCRTVDPEKNPNKAHSRTKKHIKYLTSPPLFLPIPPHCLAGKYAPPATTKFILVNSTLYTGLSLVGNAPI